MDSIIRCEMCHKMKPKQNIHICDSGHTICVNCNDCLYLSPTNEYTNVAYEKKINDLKNCNSRKDLAGGDSKQMNKKKVTIGNCGIENTGKKREVMNTFQDYLPMSSLNTTLMYKNLNFHENECNISNNDFKNDIVDINVKEKYTRPIVCPVVHCQKTVVLESILKHFAFDHPKIPALTIEMKKSLKIILNPWSLTTNTHCIAIIKSTEMQSPILLMAAKIFNFIDKSDTDVKVSKNKSDSQIHNQKKTKKMSHRNNGTESSSDYSIIMHTKMEKDIVIWICKLNNFKHLYGITVTRDHALSYSYVGEGLQVQNAQDPVNVCKNPESLIIRHRSIAKLQVDNAYLHVYIYLLK